MGGRVGGADGRTGGRAADFFAPAFTDRAFGRRALRPRAPAPLRPSVSPPVRPSAHTTYSLSPSRPPSLPNPLSRYPPNPLAASKTLVQLIQTVPALSWGATSSARLMFSVQTLAARP